MKVYRNLEDYTENKPLTLSLGMFDGVHLGHQQLICDLKMVANQHSEENAILTFWPHPRKFFNPKDEVKLLSTIEEKLKLFEKEGIENVFIQSFDEDFVNLSGEDFIRKILVEKLNVKHILIGYDHKFGKNQSGDFLLLKKLSQELHYEVEQIDAVAFNEVNVSSTKIRNALLDGKIRFANEMLSYNYSISGKVTHGKKLGRTIGYPTANLEVDELKILPKKGAYIVEVYVKGKFYKGMLSIGTNPTVNGEKLTVEVNILDFDEDIYGEVITLKFRDFLHEQIKFDGLEKLVERLDEDKRLTENFLF